MTPLKQKQRSRSAGTGADAQAITESEKVMLILAGTVLTAAGILRLRISGIILTAAGAALICRGISGRSFTLTDLGLKSDQDEPSRTDAATLERETKLSEQDRGEQAQPLAGGVKERTAHS